MNPIVGQSVIVNGNGDLFMEYEARKYIGVECVVERITKSGMYLIKHPDGSKKTFAKRNLDMPNKEITCEKK